MVAALVLVSLCRDRILEHELIGIGEEQKDTGEMRKPLKEP